MSLFRSRHLAVAALGLMVGLGASACSSSAASGSSASSRAASTVSGKAGSGAPAKVPASGLAKGLALPLEAYLLNYSEGLQIEKAQQRLTVACMSRLGFDYQPPQLGTHPPASSNDSNMPRRYGITDRAQAQVWGYHVPDRGDTSAMPPTQHLSPAEHEALTGSAGAPQPGAAPGGGKNGIPVGGCEGESRRKVDSTFMDSETLASKLNRESLDKTLQAPGVLQVERQWSACMKSKGYQANTPYDVTDLNPPAAGDKPSAREIAVALADIDCKSSTGLVAKVFAIESGIQKSLIEANQVALTAERNTINASLKASAAVR